MDPTEAPLGAHSLPNDLHSPLFLPNALTPSFHDMTEPGRHLDTAFSAGTGHKNFELLKPYMTIRWTDADKIGHEQIDAEHQQLFELVNQFLQASDKGSLTLNAMGMFKYTREHFTHEEDLMRELGYPSIRDHVRATQ